MATHRFPTTQDGILGSDPRHFFASTDAVVECATGWWLEPENEVQERSRTEPEVDNDEAKKLPFQCDKCAVSPEHTECTCADMERRCNDAQESHKHAHESGLVPVAYVRAAHEFVTRSGENLTVKPDTENGEFTGSLFLIKGGLKNPV